MQDDKLKKLLEEFEMLAFQEKSWLANGRKSDPEYDRRAVHLRNLERWAGIIRDSIK
jgi:hypothetical protein